MTTAGKVCVIGAGSSGIAASQVLNARGIPFDCFEKGSQIGGNWRYGNDNGTSSAYRSLHIISSKGLMSYATFPMPEEYPEYCDHRLVARYFDDYVDHFGFREKIRFRTEVIRVEPVDGEWEVTAEDEEGRRETSRYRAVMVANGHHWDPRWPEPPFPGSDQFAGEQMHSHYYREPEILAGKRVLVLGIGNSAVDIAVESSRHAEATFLAMRRSAYIMPKFIRGRPIDVLTPEIVTKMPIAVQRFFSGLALRLTIGKVTDYGLPEPDHKLLEAHPTVSSELLIRLGQGDIDVKPNIERFPGGRTVRFVDGSEEEVDLVVYCTGYKISFPFFDPELLDPSGDNRISLYRKVVSVENSGLYFIGFVQPLGAIMPLAEIQSEWVADLLQGSAELPAPGRMRAAIRHDQRKMAKRYVTSKRHTIQVDFHPYLREIRQERKRAARV